MPSRLAREMEPRLAYASVSETGMPPVETMTRWLNHWTDGRIKMFVTAAGLRLRRARPDLFLDGAYEPLTAARITSANTSWPAAFLGGDRVVAVVPRLVANLADPSGGLLLPADRWADTRVRLPEGWRGQRWRDVLSGQIIAPVQSASADWLPVSEVLAHCPVSILCGT